MKKYAIKIFLFVLLIGGGFALPAFAGYQSYTTSGQNITIIDVDNNAIQGLPTNFGIALCKAGFGSTDCYVGTHNGLVTADASTNWNQALSWTFTNIPNGTYTHYRKTGDPDGAYVAGHTTWSNLGNYNGSDFSITPIVLAYSAVSPYIVNSSDTIPLFTKTGAVVKTGGFAILSVALPYLAAAGIAFILIGVSLWVIRIYRYGE